MVQARLGHASASETLDTYSHLWPDSEDRTRRAIDDVLKTNAPGAEALASSAPQQAASTSSFAPRLTGV